MLIYGKSTYLLLVTAIKLQPPYPLINGSGTLLAAMHNFNSLYLESMKVSLKNHKNCEIGSVTAIDSCSTLPLFNQWFGTL